MKQSAILKASYEMIYKNLSDLGKEKKIFTVNDGGVVSPKSETDASVYVGISDICQLCPDKNGEKVEVDEILFETPAQIGCILFITITSKFHPVLLETAGSIIQYFKDNNAIIVQDYKWHGENEGKIYIEPLIRKLEPQRMSKAHDMPVVTLEYQIEMGINSLKGTPFKRVEKPIIKGNIFDQ